MKTEKIIKNRNLIFLLGAVIITIGFFNFQINKTSAAYYDLIPGDDIVVDIINPPDPAPDPVNCKEFTLPNGGVICYTLTTDISPTHIQYNWGLDSEPAVTWTATFTIIRKPANVGNITVFTNALDNGESGPFYGYNAVCGYDYGYAVACLSSANFYGNTGGQSSTAGGTATLTALRGGSQSFFTDLRIGLSLTAGGSSGLELQVPGFVINIKQYNYSVSPTSLTFQANQNGSSPVSQPITVQNTSMGDLSISVTDNATWLTVTPISLSLPNAGDTTAVLASVNTTNLSPGTYNAIITFNDPNVVNNKTVSVSYTVASGATPALSAQWTENSLTSKTINTASPECGPVKGDGSKDCTIPLTFWNSGATGSSVTVEVLPKCVANRSDNTFTVDSIICPTITLIAP